MVINAYYTALNYGVSYKALDNAFAGQKMLDKAAELVATLENAKSAPQNLEDLNSLFQTNTKKAQDTLDELIQNSIKDIIELRQSLGITEAAGQNKPLDALFETIKGAVFDTSL